MTTTTADSPAFRALTDEERGAIRDYLAGPWNRFDAVAYYAQGRIDSGEPAVVVDAPGSDRGSMFDTSHLFALLFVTAGMACEMGSGPGVPSIDRSWENFRDSLGASIYDRH